VNTLKNLSIKLKIACLVSSLLFLMISVALLGYIKLQQIGEELRNITEHDMPLTAITTEITTQQLETTILLERAIRMAGLKGNNDQFDLNQLKNQFATFSQNIDKKLGEAQSIVDQIASTPHTESESFRGTLTDLKRQHLSYKQQIERLTGYIQTNKMDEAEQHLSQLKTQQEVFNQHLEQFLGSIENMTQSALVVAEKHENTAILGMALFSSIGLFFGVVMGYLFTLALTRPLKKAVKASNQMATGDFRVSLHSNAQDETGMLINAMYDMAKRLEKAIRQILIFSRQISQTAAEMAAASEQTTHATQSQQLSTEHVLSATTELATTICQVAGNVVHASEVIQQTTKQVAVGSELALNSHKSASDLIDMIHRSSQSILGIRDQGELINSFVNTINGIADQTNLLALNAAIEAARAGEQGRGFAVVADEVRNLAQRTQEATSEIHKLIGQLQKETHSAVEVIEQSEAMVNIGAQNTQQTSQSFIEMNRSFQDVSMMCMEISSACDQQSTAAEEINQSMIGISQSGREVQDSSGHIATMSQELATLASELDVLMGQFKIDQVAA
jgi:methyl-accepting chemotaxis protein